MMTETLNDVTEGLAQEQVMSLSDLATDPGGAWPKGWYKAEVIEGYSTPKGKVFTTNDSESKNGDSRNFRICLKVTNAAGEDRNFQENVNYRNTDFSAERITDIKAGRRDNAGVRGAWSDKDLQRSSLAVGKVGQMEEAFGFTIRTSDGFVVADRTFGQKIDVRLTINDDGYNEVNSFAKAGAKTK